MHLKRWLTAIIAVPLLILLIGPGPRWLFYSILCAASLTGLTEFYKMASARLPRLVVVLACVLTLLLFVVIYLRQIMFVPAIILLWALTPMAVFMLSRPRMHLVEDLGNAIFGPVYAVLPLALVVLIDMRPKGAVWIFFLLTVIFATDTGAYYFGKLLGKHKLHETISPKKTWEGAIGGLFTSLFAASLFIRLLGPSSLTVKVMVLTAIMSAVGQIGDLCESMLKRSHGIKDSGRILPGHGGMLDRIDGLLFAVPVLYVYLSLDLGAP